MPLNFEIFSLVIRADMNESVDAALVPPPYISNIMFPILSNSITDSRINILYDIDHNMIQGRVQNFT